MTCKNYEFRSAFQSSRNPEESACEFNREKPRWRQRQRDLPIAEKVVLLGQTILETLEFEKIKKHATRL
jgi:hypothetical protein